MYDTDYNRRIREQLLKITHDAVEHTKDLYMSIDDEIPHALGDGLQYAMSDSVVSVGHGMEEAESDSDIDEEVVGGSLGYGVEEYPKNFQGNYLNTAFSTFDKPVIRPMATRQELIQMESGGCKECHGGAGVRHEEVVAEMREHGEEPLLTTKQGRGLGSDLMEGIKFSRTPEGQALTSKLMDMFKGLKGKGADKCGGSFFNDSRCLGINPDPSCRADKDAYNNMIMRLQDKLPSIPSDIKQMIMSGKGKKKVEAYLKGTGFFDDLWSGIKDVGSVALKVLPYAVALGKPSKARGRPRKLIGLKQTTMSPEEYSRELQIKKGLNRRGRGRPKKGGAVEVLEHLKDESSEQKEGGNIFDTIGDVVGGIGSIFGLGQEGQGKKKRGRPSKKGGNIGLAQSEESRKFFEELSKKGGNIGLAQSEESRKHFEGGKKKRGRPSKKEGGAVLPEASSSFGAKLEGGNFLTDVLGGLSRGFLGLGQEGGKKKRGRPSKKEGGRMLVENQQLQGHYGGARVPKACKSGIRDRAKIVKKIMEEKGMSMIEASKYVKEKGLY